MPIHGRTMPRTTYKLSDYETGRIRRQIRRVAGGWADLCRADSRYETIFAAIGPLLTRLLGRKSLRAEGSWRDPTAEERDVAAKVIIWLSITLADGRPERIASAAEVRRDLDRIEASLVEAAARIWNCKKRTRNWIAEHLEESSIQRGDSGRSPMQHYESFGNTCLMLCALAGGLREGYRIREEQEANRAVKKCYDRAIQLWFLTTGCWPVTSKNASWPIEAQPLQEEWPGLYNGDGKTAPPLLFMLRIAVTMAAPASSTGTSMHRQTFVEAVASMRNQASQRSIVAVAKAGD
jgi:hypothetical protein